MIHHSALSFRKLTSMKIVDRSSCYVYGISKDMADKAMLGKYEMFGRFGEILSIRIIQDKDPCEVYIRYASQSAAVRAINWCNNSRLMAGLDAGRGYHAKHGYHKYCVKFVNGHRCKRSSNCPNRHSWADTADIITFKNSRLANDPLPLRPLDAAQLRHHQEMKAMRQQFATLQKQYAQQMHVVQDLHSKMQQLQRCNVNLQQQLQRMRLGHQALLAQQPPQCPVPSPAAGGGADPRAVRPFLVHWPGHHLLADIPLPPDRVGDGALDEIVDRVLRSDSSSLSHSEETTL